MKVKELIQELQKFNEEADVYVATVDIFSDRITIEEDKNEGENIIVIVLQD